MSVDSVGREKGLSGVIDVEWDIADALTNQIQGNGGDFIVANGSIRFNPGDLTQSIRIQPRADLVPENDKDFRVRLTGLTGNINRLIKLK